MNDRISLSYIAFLSKADCNLKGTSALCYGEGMPGFRCDELPVLWHPYFSFECQLQGQRQRQYMLCTFMRIRHSASCTSMAYSLLPAEQSAV